jgi:hypothetical protein
MRVVAQHEWGYRRGSTARQMARVELRIVDRYRIPWPHESLFHPQGPALFEDGLMPVQE